MESITESVHKTVLLQETIEGLNLKKGATVLDATFGGGGHTVELCKRGMKVIAIDQDKDAWQKAKSKFAGLNCDVTFVNDNFSNIDKVLAKEKVGEVDGIIFDLGLSSDQLENSGRGFSFMKEEPLLMTFKSMKENPSPEDLTAMDIVNSWSEESIADIIFGYGEEKQARRIAKYIVDLRQKKQIKTTGELVSIIEQAIPAKFRKGKIHFATKTFQALRMAVNDELGVLGQGLEKGFEALKVGGRMSVITFHSLEDRVVKRFFKEKEINKKGKLINKKVIVASEVEIKNNKRSRSAKLRIIEKIN